MLRRRATRRFLNSWEYFRWASSKKLRLDPRRFWRFFNLDRLIYYRTRAIDKVLAYSRLPDGCLAVHFWDSFPTLDLIYSLEIYEKLHKIGERDTVFDCGASDGIFTLKASKRARQGRVIAVEPEQFNYKLLELNIKNNQLANTVATDYALTDGTPRMVKLYLDDLSEGHSLKEPPEKGLGAWRRRVEFVHANSLDNVAKAFHVTHADFVKISVNGSELDVIRGARQILQKCTYVVIQYDKKLTKISELASSLQRLGFKRASSLDCLLFKMGFAYFVAPTRIAA